ncbi:MAG: response regulator [Chloroflexi bacterium]|nr:response regulator [Chloroflexota bacterium]
MAKILIIEDQESLCNLYRTVLRTFNHDIVFATTGAAGVEAAQADRPDLIILDLLLPEMPGAEVAEKLLELGILPDVPLIVTTALDQMEAKFIAESVGAVAVLNKPFSVNSMIELLNGILDGSGPKALSQERSAA